MADVRIITLRTTQAAYSMVESEAAKANSTVGDYVMHLANIGWVRKRQLRQAKRDTEPLGPHERAEVTVETTFRGRLAETLLDEARARRVPPVELLADIVETVLGENLITPVLDDRSEEQAR